MDPNFRTGLALLVLTVSLVLLVLAMTAQDYPRQVTDMDFNSVQFHFIPAEGDSPKRVHRLEAMQGENKVGDVQWHPGNGTISSAWVDKEARGQGLALNMLRHIQENHMPTYPNGRQMRLQHSDNRTPDGERFAQATKSEFYAPRNRAGR